MAYNKPQHVREKLTEHLRKDFGISKGKAREMAEKSVRRTSDKIEKQVRDGDRPAT